MHKIVKGKIEKLTHLAWLEGKGVERESKNQKLTRNGLTVIKKILHPKLYQITMYFLRYFHLKSIIITAFDIFQI